MALRGATRGGQQYEFASHVGRVRKTNEDAAGACKETGVIVVADGMGGHVEGATASRLVVDGILEASRKGVPLIDAICKADQAIAEHVAKESDARGMGSTVIAAKINGIDYEIAWVGDSRAYLWHGGLKRITRDHSLVQQRIDDGLIHPDEEASQPDRNVLERALTGQGLTAREIGQISGRLFDGEALVLCTDGLHGMANDQQIASVIEAHMGGDVADELVNLALIQGGEDNVTVALIQPAAGTDARPRESKTVQIPVVQLSAKSRVPRMIGIIFAALIIALSAWLLIDKSFRPSKPTGGAAAEPILPAGRTAEKEGLTSNEVLVETLGRKNSGEASRRQIEQNEAVSMRAIPPSVEEGQGNSKTASVDLEQRLAGKDKAQALQSGAEKNAEGEVRHVVRDAELGDQGRSHSVEVLEARLSEGKSHPVEAASDEHEPDESLKPIAPSDSAGEGGSETVRKGLEELLKPNKSEEESASEPESSEG